MRTEIDTVSTGEEVSTDPSPGSQALMSTPMTRPSSPTRLAARKQSNPAPRSSTVSPALGCHRLRASASRSECLRHPEPPRSRKPCSRARASRPPPARASPAFEIRARVSEGEARRRTPPCSSQYRSRTRSPPRPCRSALARPAGSLVVPLIGHGPLLFHMLVDAAPGRRTRTGARDTGPRHGAPAQEVFIALLRSTPVSAERRRRRRATLPAGVSADDPGHPQEHIYEHDQRRGDDDRQREQSFWLSGFHAPPLLAHSAACAAQRGRVGCLGLARPAGLASGVRSS